jgi:hypothetical protein
MKTIFWLIKKFAFGFVALYAFNFIGSYIDISIAANLLSYLLIGTFGLPGLLLVYIGNIFLGT